MESTQLKRRLIETNCSVVYEQDGLTVYELQTENIQKDEENKVQVVSVGPRNAEVITKSVLLLGETGAGKTRIINAMLNHLLGVRHEDNFRFQLKDYIESCSREQVESQTDYITAYVIYHQAGMPLDSNYILIDTPGFGDTRINHQGVLVQRLCVFLTTNFGINDLNCIALVAKANQNRISRYQIEMMQEFTSILSSDLSCITHVLATFASDDTLQVFDVVRHAGFEFTNSYKLDNWPLYIAYHTSQVHEDDRAHVLYRWNRMKIQYAKFFEDLRDSPTVDLKRTRDLLRETTALEETKRRLNQDVKDTAQLINLINKEKLLRDQLQLQATTLKSKTEEINFVKQEVPAGYHAHNCQTCAKTFTGYCPDPSNAEAAFAGTGTGVGTAAAAGVGTAVASGAIIGAEVGIFGGPIGVMIGGAVGTAIGLASGLTVGLLKRKNRKDCPFPVACEPGHKLITEDFKYVTVLKDNMSDKEKMRYDNLVNRREKLNLKIVKNESNLNNYKVKLSDTARTLVQHIRTIHALSMGRQTLQARSVIEEMISEERERENLQYIELLEMMKRAVDLFSVSDETVPLQDIRAEEQFDIEVLK